eukprot:TRINITY_DN3914_c0_g1_i1.p2 TRINITY_DN3914_c0_g1~~TRINITY_DN3914_c0_g1_i1.p2  ORF type:complete len:218 (+),score=23.89 TRINITY_DN3914_c0_g1_i1:46-699(+)
MGCGASHELGHTKLFTPADDFMHLPRTEPTPAPAAVPALKAAPTAAQQTEMVVKATAERLRDRLDNPVSPCMGPLVSPHAPMEETAGSANDSLDRFRVNGAAGRRLSALCLLATPPTGSPPSYKRRPPCVRTPPRSAKGAELGKVARNSNGSMSDISSNSSFWSEESIDHWMHGTCAPRLALPHPTAAHVHAAVGAVRLQRAIRAKRAAHSFLPTPI